MLNSLPKDFRKIIPFTWTNRYFISVYYQDRHIFVQNTNRIIMNGKFYGIAIHDFMTSKSNHSIKFTCISSCRSKCNLIIYFLIYKKWFDFLNIIAVIVCDSIAKLAWRFNSLCNFRVIIRKFSIGI